MRQFTAALAVAATTGVALAAAGKPRISPEATDGVRLAPRWFAEPVRRAVHGAARRLGDPSCQSVLEDFKDRTGRTLRERLEELSLDAPSYSRMVLVYDGSNARPCRENGRLYAFTRAGSRVVWACPALAGLALADPRMAEAIIIHEVLHTLGLGENPPSAESITARVESRCRS